MSNITLNTNKDVNTLNTTSNSGNFHLHEFPVLPVELFNEHIFPNLGMSDMIRFRAVCPLWNKKINQLFQDHWNAFVTKLASSQQKAVSQNIYHCAVTLTDLNGNQLPVQCFVKFFKRVGITWNNTLDMAIKSQHIISLKVKENDEAKRIGPIDKAFQGPWQLVINKKTNKFRGYHRNEKDSHGHLKVYDMTMHNKHLFSIEKPAFLSGNKQVIPYNLNGNKYKQSNVELELRDFESVFAPNDTSLFQDIGANTSSALVTVGSTMSSNTATMLQGIDLMVSLHVPFLQGLFS